MFHVPHHDEVAVEIIPPDANDFLLPARREDREGDDPLHEDGVGSPRFHYAEVLKEPVKLCQRWSPFPLSSLGGYPELLGDDESILHHLLIERVSPRWAGHGEDRGKM